jgi:hypothetical protein
LPHTGSIKELKRSRARQFEMMNVSSGAGVAPAMAEVAEPGYNYTDELCVSWNLAGFRRRVFLELRAR